MMNEQCVLHSQQIVDTREDVIEIRSSVKRIENCLLGDMKHGGIINKVIIMWNCSKWVLVTAGGAAIIGCVKLFF